MKLGQELTVTFRYGEPLCNTCKHQKKRGFEEPCLHCSSFLCFWEPKRSAKK